MNKMLWIGGAFALGYYLGTRGTFRPLVSGIRETVSAPFEETEPTRAEEGSM
jgi:hypothetical protein